LLINLLVGYFNSDTINKDIARFRVPLHENMLFQVVILMHENSHLAEEDGFKQFMRLKEYLNQQMVTFELIEAVNGDIVAILYVAQEENRQRLPTKEQLEMHFKVEQNVKLIIGTPEEGLIGISKSYQFAKELIASPVSQVATLNLMEKRYYYPIDWEIQLIHQLKVGNDKVVSTILTELKKENLERNLPAEAARKVTSLIFETFVRIMEDTDLDAPKAREEFEMIQQSDDVGWSWDYLLAFAKLICNRMEYFNLTSTRDIGIEILAYVEKNYCNSNLSLQLIADLHDLSVSAISKIFKATVKVNFSDYLQLLRVHRAKEYFDKGETDVAETARKVGYENEITFKRAFQKAEFLTPRKYVQQQRLK